MTSSSAPALARRRPPVPAIAAGVLGLLSTAVPALFALLALAFSNGRYGDGGWLVVLVPLVLAVLLPTGAVLLLVGRSWLVLALGAGLLVALLVWGYAGGAWGDPTFGVLTVVLPLAAAVLSVLPSVRRWVAARRGRGGPLASRA